jgi:hypothetical protein
VPRVSAPSLIVRNRANKRISLTHGLVAKRQYRGDRDSPKSAVVVAWSADVCTLAFCDS